MQKSLRLGLRESLYGLSDHNRHKVVVVAGAPGSGKSHYVNEHRGASDLVVDLDHLCAALQGTSSLYEDHDPVLRAALRAKDAVIDEVRAGRGHWETAYVVTADPDLSQVQALAAELDAELVRMEASLDDCIRNIEHDDRRGDRKESFIQLARDWYMRQHIEEM